MILQILWKGLPDGRIGLEKPLPWTAFEPSSLRWTTSQASDLWKQSTSPAQTTGLKGHSTQSFPSSRTSASLLHSFVASRLLLRARLLPPLRNGCNAGGTGALRLTNF